MLSISDSALLPHFSLCLSSSRARQKSCSGKTVNQPLKYHGGAASRDIYFFLEPLTEFSRLSASDFCSTLSVGGCRTMKRVVGNERYMS